MMFHVWKPKKITGLGFFNCCEAAIISPKRSMFHLVQCGTVLNCNSPVWNGLKWRNIEHCSIFLTTGGPGPYCFSGAWLNIISPSVQPTKLPMSRYVTSDPSADKEKNRFGHAESPLVMHLGVYRFWETIDFAVFRACAEKKLSLAY